MSRPVRTAAVLGTLVAVLALATAWGWQAATAPFPSEEESPDACTETTLRAGERLTTGDVVVSVFNGSDRPGLAGATMEQLVARGFIAGETGNAPVDEPLRRAEIWTADSADPVVRLVRRQFRRARVVEGQDLGPGVDVVMGRSFTSLRTPVESIEVREDTTYCSATVVP